MQYQRECLAPARRRCMAIRHHYISRPYTDISRPYTSHRYMVTHHHYIQQRTLKCQN